MGEAFAWMLPLIQLAFGILLVAVRRLGAGIAALWWGTAFLVNAGAFAAPALDSFCPELVSTVLGDTLFAVAFFFYGQALLARHRRPPMTALRLALLAVAIIAPACAVAFDSLPAELAASDVTCSLEIAVALIRVPLWPARRLDRGMVLLSWLVVIDNLGRTASVPFTAAGATFATYLSAEYGTLMQTTCMLAAIAFAPLALSAVTLDMVEADRREARQDPLTGLLNRRGLMEGGASIAWRRGSVVTCDLDHFKRVNDTWGHEAGDRVLVAFAELIRRVLPPGAVAARVGGEEFVLHLPGLGVREAGALVERLRGAMRVHPWHDLGIVGRQTASFGVAARTPADGTLGDVIRRADRGLYEAKRAGRDRVEVRLVA